MTLQHQESTQTDPFARGTEIGNRWRPEIATTLRRYEQLFDAAGLTGDTARQVAQECFDELDRWAPDLAAEVRGVGEGAGLELWQAATLSARTEILVRGRIAGMSECTSAAWLPSSGPPHALQTWDWNPAFDEFLTIRHTSPAGLRVAAFSEPGVLSKVGVNSAGIGLLCTLLCHTSDGSTAGVPVHAVARRVLDNATSIAEAVAIVTSVPITASVCFTVLQYSAGNAGADAGADAGSGAAGVVIEAAPSGSTVLAAERGYLLHTNHFLAGQFADGDRLVAVGDDTLPRMEVLLDRKSVITTGNRTDWAHGLVSHWADGAPICAHPRSDAEETNRWETKMVFSLDLAVPALWVHPGGPCGVRSDGWLEVRA